AEQADVEINAIERTQRTDRIGAVLENSRRPDGPWPGEELRQRVVRPDELVELPVEPLAAQDRFASPLPRQTHSRREVVDRIHRARIVDVVGRDERGIERARTRDMKRLIEQ